MHTRQGEKGNQYFQSPPIETGFNTILKKTYVTNSQ